MFKGCSTHGDYFTFFELEKPVRASGTYDLRGTSTRTIPTTFVCEGTHGWIVGIMDTNYEQFGVYAGYKNPLDAIKSMVKWVKERM